MNANNKYLMACKVFNKVDFYKRKSTQMKYLQIAKTLIEDCLKEQPKDFESWYLLGLIWYWFPRETQSRDKNCEKALKKAIKFKSDDDWSNMYLGYLYFDQRKFRKAIKFFQIVNRNSFKEVHLHWRILKLDELIICCKLHLDFDNFTISEFENYKKLCESSLKNDGFDYIFPLELTRCLVELSNLKKINKVKLKKLFSLFKSLLKNTNNLEIFEQDINKIEINL